MCVERRLAAENIFGSGDVDDCGGITELLFIDAVTRGANSPTHH